MSSGKSIGTAAIAAAALLASMGGYNFTPRAEPDIEYTPELRVRRERDSSLTPAAQHRRAQKRSQRRASRRRNRK